MNKNSTAFCASGIGPRWTSSAKDGGMLPELIWEGDVLPDRAMKRGSTAGSAIPLCWSHAECMQPEEEITLQIRAKTPGPTIRPQAVALDFDHSRFDAVAPTKGYEKLLHDSIVGDSTLFHPTDMLEAAWRVAYPIVNASENSPPQIGPNSAAGTWGPQEVDQLLQRGGHRGWTG